MKKKIKILAFAGSLRKGSYNKAVLRELGNISKDKSVFEIFDLEEIPLFNQDTEAGGMPELVKEFREKVAGADGVIIASPEYNYSVTGVLKNAIDWLSRKPDAPLEGKPLGILGTSTGMFGTVRAQMHLRQTLIFLNPKLMNKPEIYIGNAAAKFDESGNLTDEKTKQMLERYAEAFTEHVKSLRSQS